MQSINVYHLATTFSDLRTDLGILTLIFDLFDTTVTFFQWLTSL
jgi:hypothetical protein